MTLVSGALLGKIVDDVALALAVGGVGVLLMIIGTWWWKRGFQFPDEDQLRAVVRPNQGGTWGIDLEFPNPGRTDRFAIRVDEILGAKSPTGAIGTYPKWRGETEGDTKLIRRGDRATFSLCTWGPVANVSGSDGYDDPIVTSTVHASTGDTAVLLTAAGVKFDKLPRHELVFQLRVVSDKTERQARYDVHVGAISTSDPSPRVHVGRRYGP